LGEQWVAGSKIEGWIVIASKSNRAFIIKASSPSLDRVAREQERESLSELIAQAAKR